MPNRIVVSLILSLLLVTSLLLVACGSPSNLDKKSGATSFTAAQLVPLGNYSIRLSREDNPELPSYSDLLGKWKLKLIDGNSFSASLDGKVVVEGQYYTILEKIFFSDQSGIYACLEPQDQDLSGYNWNFNFNEEALSLQANNDNCNWRRAVLTSFPLTREEL
jgi:hypothetical protein